MGQGNVPRLSPTACDAYFVVSGQSLTTTARLPYQLMEQTQLEEQTQLLGIGFYVQLLSI